jgi:hypothetical protein
VLGDIRDKTQKIWEDLGEFGRLDLAWLGTLEEARNHLKK